MKKSWRRTKSKRVLPRKIKLDYGKGVTKRLKKGEVDTKLPLGVLKDSLEGRIKRQQNNW